VAGRLNREEVAASEQGVDAGALARAERREAEALAEEEVEVGGRGVDARAYHACGLAHRPALLDEHAEAGMCSDGPERGRGCRRERNPARDHEPVTRPTRARRRASEV
jgi:hypothetical protein